MVHGKTPFWEGIAAPKHRLVPYSDGFDVMAKPDALGCGKSRTIMQ